MKSMMHRTTLREIKQSFGRYFAILAIVALGVGFFAGLKVTRQAMVVSVDNYLKEEQFYDYRLLSTLGFEEEDVAALAAKAGVRAVEGAVSADIICVDGKGNESVLKAHSMTEEINGIVLTAGRLPQKPDECVVDSNLYGESAIGTKVILSENNEQEDLDHFTYREYTITGIVQSSYYIQFERGNSSLGSGRISGFMYLLPDGFQMEYYTEIFVKFEEDYPLYSEEYDAFIEAQEPLWETYCEEQGHRRYQAILDEANAEYKDAEAEYEESRAKAESELADARAELADGEEKLADARAEIEDGEEKLADGEKEIADAESTISQKEQELADARQTIADNEALLQEKKAAYQSGMAAYEEGRAQLTARQQEYSAALEQITAVETELANAQAELEELAALAEAGFLTPEQLALYEQKKAEFEATKAALNLEEKKAALSSAKDQINAADLQLNNSYKALQNGAVQITNAETALAEAKEQLTEGEAALEEAKTELEEAKEELSEKKAELADAKEEVEEASAELEEGWTEYNDAYAEFEEETAKAEKELADARADIEAIEEPDTYVLGRDTNVGYVCFESDSNIVEGIANVFPVFFFLVAALICMTTMNRMVEEQRTQIGVLKALGYGEGRIMGKYLFYSGSAAVIGSVAGFFLGTHLFPLVIWNTYGIMYRLGALSYVFDWKLALISLLVAILCSMGTTWFSCRQELKEVAAGLMRPKAPKAGKRVFLERVPFIWKRLKFLHKVSVRNIVRYKKRFFMMVLGISGCTALLVTGFGIKDSIADVATQQFEEIQIYTLGVAMQDGKSTAGEEAVAESLQTIEEHGGTYLFLFEKSIDLEVKGRIKSINLVMAEQPEQIGAYIDLHTSGKESIPYPGPGEVVLSDKIADTYGVRVGNEIVLRDENRREIHARVSGICQNFVYNYAYLHPQTYTEQIGEVEYKNLCVNLPEEADAHLLGAALMKQDNVTSVTVNADTMERFSSMLKSLDYIVLVVLMCAAALAFIVLYNLNNINITERIREIATIKVLGFYRKETASYVFRENMVLTGIGCGLGLVLGKCLHTYVMHEINIDMISFDVHVTWLSYLFSIMLTFLFTWLVNRMMSGKINRISMTESLKSVD